MQSSPPVRAIERESSAPESQYSLDLGALDLDAQSDSSDPIPKPPVTRILSEDIDGPSDFTQNMEMWMKGGTLPKGTSKAKGFIPMPIQEDEKERELDSVLAGKVEQGHKDQGLDNKDSQDEGALPVDDNDSSEWDPYGAASTPAAQGGRQFLQPTVEEYVSEITPAMQSQTQTVRGRATMLDQTHRNAVYNVRKHSASKESASPSPGRPSSPTLSPVRSPVTHRVPSRNDGSQDEDRRILEAELQRLRTKCKQLEQTNGVLSKVLADERRIHRHEDGARALRQGGQLAGQSNNMAEATERAHLEELEEQQEIHDAEMARLRAEVDSAHQHESMVADLERQLRMAKSEIERLNGDKLDADDDLDNLRTQLAMARQGQGIDAPHAADERSRAVDLAANFQRQLQDLRKQLRDDQASHETELQRLASEHRQARETSTREVDVIRAEHGAQQSELNEAIIERDEAQDLLQNVQTERDSLKAELEDMKAVNAALDASVRDTMQDRDQRWKDKLEAAHRERKVMSKALLHQWGREEVGIESPQRYAYKYGPTKTSPWKAKVSS